MMSIARLTRVFCVEAGSVAPVGASADSSSVKKVPRVRVRIQLGARSRLRIWRYPRRPALTARVNGPGGLDPVNKGFPFPLGRGKGTALDIEREKDQLKIAGFMGGNFMQVTGPGKNHIPGRQRVALAVVGVGPGPGRDQAHLIVVVQVQAVRDLLVEAAVAPGLDGEKMPAKGFLPRKGISERSHWPK
jgi:hypothetical protein